MIKIYVLYRIYSGMYAEIFMILPLLLRLQLRLQFVTYLRDDPRITALMQKAIDAYLHLWVVILWVWNIFRWVLIYITTSIPPRSIWMKYIHLVSITRVNFAYLPSLYSWFFLIFVVTVTSDTYVQKSEINYIAFLEELEDTYRCLFSFNWFYFVKNYGFLLKFFSYLHFFIWVLLFCLILHFIVFFC